MVVLEDRAGADPELSRCPVRGRCELLPVSPRPPGRRDRWYGQSAQSEAWSSVCAGGRGQRQAGGLSCMARGAVSFLSSSQCRDGAQGKDTWDPKTDVQQLRAGLQDRRAPG